MSFNPIHNRRPDIAIGNIEDTKATDATSEWSMVALLKGIWDKLNTGIATTGAQTDDAAFTVGTTKVEPVAGIYKSVRDSVDDNDAGALAMTAKRGLLVVIETPNGDSVLDDTNDAVKIVAPVAGAGAVTALTPRVTLASDDPGVASLSVLDDWDESDRAKVNVIAGQAGITAGAGAVAANTPRATLASDDPAVVALQIIDDWDETDRAKVNIIAGQAGVTAGAGAVAANTPRVTLASDDPVTTAVQIMDDWDESDRAKVNPIVGQAGVAAGAGAVAATVQRVTLASDDPLVSKTPNMGAVSSATITSVNSAATSTSLLASNANRKGVILFNTDANEVYVKYGATASATSFTVKIAAGGYWEMPLPIYTGAIDGIWGADGAGAAVITEL